MDDRDILELYNARNESAIDRTAEKYGSYCRAVDRRGVGDGCQHGQSDIVPHPQKTAVCLRERRVFK